MGSPTSGWRLRATGQVLAISSRRARCSGRTSRGMSIARTSSPMRRGGGVIRFSTLARASPQESPSRRATSAIVLSAQDASAAPTRSVGEKSDPSPPLSFGGTVEMVAPDGPWSSWQDRPEREAVIGTPAMETSWRGSSAGSPTVPCETPERSGHGPGPIRGSRRPRSRDPEDSGDRIQAPPDLGHEPPG
jgi:hypothetical protein